MWEYVELETIVSGHDAKLCNVSHVCRNLSSIDPNNEGVLKRGRCDELKVSMDRTGNCYGT